MQSFIVRVYRRAVGSRGEPSCTLERVAGADRVAFTNRDDLLARLFRSRKPARRAPHAVADANDAFDDSDFMNRSKSDDTEITSD
jgi:hypothetical protein